MVGKYLYLLAFLKKSQKNFLHLVYSKPLNARIKLMCEFQKRGRYFLNSITKNGVNNVSISLHSY